MSISYNETKQCIAQQFTLMMMMMTIVHKNSTFPLTSINKPSTRAADATVFFYYDKST